MSIDINLFGRDTFEVISLDQARGDFWLNWQLLQFGGPNVLLNILDEGEKFKVLNLYPEHLSLLYARFKKMNPSGVEVGPNTWYEEKYPYPEAKDLLPSTLFYPNLTLTNEEAGYPYLKKYLPEIFEKEMIKKMSDDPWLDNHLLGDAIKEGFVRKNMESHPRWSPEWRIYCNQLTSAKR